MKGYNTSLAGGWLWVVLAGALCALLLLLTATPVEGREAKGGYEVYKQRHQRQQQERQQMQLRQQREEKNSEFVKGKSKWPNQTHKQNMSRKKMGGKTRHKHNVCRAYRARYRLSERFWDAARVVRKTHTQTTYYPIGGPENGHSSNEFRTKNVCLIAAKGQDTLAYSLSGA
ncbi:peptide synthetase [Anopheles sinensis]|uniref:Peptide synthetase n=1 Tax=Anopheles sinensis TaxID=74873 RepID=A0A084VSX6_ANOSI|nr:peptide synthetase [Anopheles sinensis]